MFARCIGGGRQSGGQEDDGARLGASGGLTSLQLDSMGGVAGEVPAALK